MKLEHEVTLISFMDSAKVDRWHVEFRYRNRGLFYLLYKNGQVYASGQHPSGHPTKQRASEIIKAFAKQIPKNKTE